jgi:hypothetical protein
MAAIPSAKPERLPETGQGDMWGVCGRRRSEVAGARSEPLEH